MSVQRKRYLQLASQTTEPRSKLFYKLMAEVAPAVSEMARKNVNQVGPTIIYDVVLRLASGLLLETAFNLSTRGIADLDALTTDFRTALEHAADSHKVMGSVECAPHLDA